MNQLPLASLRMSQLVAGALFCMCTSFGQVNSWTNPASGNWEDLKWSLGTRPSTNDSVMITNANWKAVGIGPITVANFPSTMTVSNLTISAPTDSMNTLLLNFSGLTSPLRVLGQLTVNTNGNLVVDSSALWLDGFNRFIITNATATVSSSFVAATNSETKISGGRLNLSDSDTRFSSMFVGITAPSTVTQHNGTNRCPGLYIATFDFSSGAAASTGEYDLTNGTFLGNYAAVGYAADGTFRQSGGRVAVDALDLGWGGSGGSGSYFLYSGDVSATTITIGKYSGQGTFIQTGGTNRTTTLRLGADANPLYYPQSAGYSLSNGLLATANTTVGHLYGSCGFGQSGGTFIVTNQLSVSGTAGTHSIYERYLSGFGIQGGSCKLGSLFLDQFSGFSQSGGDLTVYRHCQFRWI